jgi:hypothetical protein
VRHQPGDVLLVRWTNAEHDVATTLADLALDGGRTVSVSTASSGYDPGRVVTSSLADVLTQVIDLAGAPGAHSNLARLPDLRRWPRLTTRTYTVTDIVQHGTGETVEILVSHRRSRPAGSEWVGSGCRGYWARSTPGQEVRAWPAAGVLSVDLAGAPPVLVVATGIAAAGPLFEHRCLAAARRAGPLWLVMGLGEFAPHQPWQWRVLDHVAAHPGSRLDIALSRDDSPGYPHPMPVPSQVTWFGHSRVHDVLTIRRDDVATHLHGGGAVAVIGHDAMGSRVRFWLRGLIESQWTPGEPGRAEALLRSWESDRRVQYSLS